MPPRNTSRTPRPRSRSMPADKIPVPTEPTEEQIRMRAYEIYVARNGAPGDPNADWRQAEQELRGRMTLLGQA